MKTKKEGKNDKKVKNQTSKEFQVSIRAVQQTKQRQNRMLGISGDKLKFVEALARILFYSSIFDPRCLFFQ